MDERDLWLSLIDNQATPEQKDRLLSSAVNQLAAFVAAQPEATTLVLEVLGRRLDEGISDRSWESLDASLRACLGSGPSFLLTWLILGEAADQTRLDDVGEHASPETMALIRTSLGAYGDEMREAFVRWQQLPNDWRTFYRDVYTNLLTNLPLIRIRILKYNGEELLVEGSATSILGLATNIVLTLQSVATAGAFVDEGWDEFEESVRRLRLMSTEDVTAEPAQSEPAAQVPAESDT